MNRVRRKTRQPIRMKDLRAKQEEDERLAAICRKADRFLGRCAGCAKQAGCKYPEAYRTEPREPEAVRAEIEETAKKLELVWAKLRKGDRFSDVRDPDPFLEEERIQLQERFDDLHIELQAVGGRNVQGNAGELKTES